MRRHEACGWLGALALCLAAASALAIPPQLAHEGLAVDGAGRPLEGQHDVRVRFYRDAVGGAAVFDERHADVAFFDGYYQLRIGTNEALDGALFDGDIHVGLAFDGGPELLPRQALGAVPGVLVADVAATASGHCTRAAWPWAGCPWWTPRARGAARWTGCAVALAPRAQRAPPGRRAPGGRRGPRAAPDRPTPRPKSGPS